MKIAILGFGREGKSVLKFLKKNDPRAEIKILDRKSDKPPHHNKDFSFFAPKVPILVWCGGKNYLKNLDKFDVVFRSPGIPYNLPEIQKAIKSSVKFSSATKLFFDEAEKIGCKIIGITGTKGKGTTATLLYKILKACGKKVLLAGNIGKPAIEILVKLKKNSIVILELSSFQLQDLEKSPDIAVILDIFPDHLDMHKNLREYFDAKANIAKYQKKTDKIFYFNDNKPEHKKTFVLGRALNNIKCSDIPKWIAQKSRGKKIAVSAKNSELFKPDDLKMPGEHNFKNAVMAATVALSLGCPKEKIIKVVENFRGNEHRLELVRTIHRYTQIRKQINTDENKIRVHPCSHPRSSVSIKFYNDSASTNPQTAAAAIRAFKEPKILISGGKDKGLNYSPLSQALKNSNTKLIILFGENKNKIARAIKNSRVPIKLVKDLKSSVNLAYKTAKQLQQLQQLEHHNDIAILFSPASASFDMFKDYADRGKKFKEIVKGLK